MGVVVRTLRLAVIFGVLLPWCFVRLGALWLWGKLTGKHVGEWSKDVDAHGWQPGDPTCGEGDLKWRLEKWRS